MIRTYIVEYTPIIVLVIIALFALTKLLIINMMGLREDPFRLYLNSHQVYSKQIIKNTFHKGIQRYYKLSNKINAAVYSGLAVLMVLYMFSM